MKDFVRKVFLAGAVIGNSSISQSTKCDPIDGADELPMYTSENDSDENANAPLYPAKIGIIEGTFGAIRTQIWSAMDQCMLYQKEAEIFFQRGSDYAASLYTYLSEEADETTKMRAIAAGALTVMAWQLFAIRRQPKIILKKLTKNRENMQRLLASPTMAGRVARSCSSSTN